MAKRKPLTEEEIGTYIDGAIRRAHNGKLPADVDAARYGWAVYWLRYVVNDNISTAIMRRHIREALLAEQEHARAENPR